jgi:hypothetical protein
MKCALFFILAGAALGAGWDAVQRIQPGAKVDVTLNDGAHARGGFVSADGESVVVREEAGERAMARAEVRQVRVAEPGRRVRKGLIWTAVGVGAGAGIGAAICPQCPNEGQGMKYIGPGAAIGAGLGALGFLSSPWRTIYRSR